MTAYNRQKHQLVRAGIQLSAILWLMLFSVMAQAAVDARIDRNNVKLGETITLVVETDDTAQTLDIDTELLKADFHVLDTRNESMVSITNGARVATIRTLYVLEPKRTGKLIIPVFTLGKLSTQPLEINVEAAPAVAAGEPPVVFMEIESNSDSAYVHSQLALTVRLFYRYSLTEGSLPDPQVEHATLVKLGETSMNATRNGVSYRALERIYAVFPERSGELVIPEISFLGRVNEPSKQRGSLFTPMRNRGRRVRTASDSLTITVEPRPLQYPAAADWLPARQLVVNSQIKTAKGGARVGEPVTRVIEMKAVGLLDTMFPEINWPLMDNARVYPDAPESVSRNSGQWVTGRKVHSFAIVPENMGELLLPEISIPWWDTIEDELKYAVIPAEIVDVLPALGDSAIVDPEPDPLPVKKSPQTDETIEAEPAKPATSSEEKSWWQIFAVTGFTLWLLTLLLWWLNRRKPQQLIESSSLPQSHENTLAGFKNACNKNQPLAAATALRLLVIRELDISDGISGLHKRCLKDGFDQLAGSVEALNNQLYAQGKSADTANWDGKAFYQQFESWLKATEKNSKARPNSNSLPPFYPE